jgi:chromatin remodeling complex protein RSC6
MTKQQIIDAWTAVEVAEANEMALGEQIALLTVEQRKAHQATRTARDIAENLIEDTVITTKAEYSGGYLSAGEQPLKAEVEF